MFGGGDEGNTNNPFVVQTALLAPEQQAAMEKAREQHAMNRFADPAGAAEFIFRLATSMPHVTGQLFVLDGRIR